MIIQRLITTKFGTCFGGGEVENSGEGVRYTPCFLWWVVHIMCCFMLHSPRHIIALSFDVFEEFTVRSFCLGDAGWLVIHIFLMVAHSGFFKELVFIVVFFFVFILLQVLRYTHAVPFQWHLFNQASVGQNTNQLCPTIFIFPLASLLRTSIALHCLWFLNSVQHSMPLLRRKM